ncbi:uncharacterized protein LOC114289337 [Camellia sinensis]|uniref:uncharacterized protein LOC114289337 n=1 Tax=Camellia sinensis TaxID=4442 RepID=UPI001035DE93|nr:uncharacterized protein LOC114289337 [Camellia sinensis]
MKPTFFKGGIEPMKAEAWVLGIEKLFEVFPCTESSEVLPQSMRDKKVTEFETLRQGNKTVAEYEAQFAELARFAPHMVDTDYKKTRKFEGGLRSAILDKVNMLKLPTYVDVLERAVNSGRESRYSRVEFRNGKGKGKYSMVEGITYSTKQKADFTEFKYFYP